jgi:hypothetical protein
MHRQIDVPILKYELYFQIARTIPLHQGLPRDSAHCDHFRVNDRCEGGDDT